MFNNNSHYSHMFKDGPPLRELVRGKFPLGKFPPVKVPLWESPPGNRAL